MDIITFIHIIHHSDGVFRVYKNLGVEPEMKDRIGNDFATLDDGRVYAKQLQAKAGGPDKARIIEARKTGYRSP